MLQQQHVQLPVVAAKVNYKPGNNSNHMNFIYLMIPHDGVLRVVSYRHRTQRANRRAAEERLYVLLSAAIFEKPTRHQTAIPRRSRQRRVQDKRARSTRKTERGRISLDRADD